MSHLNNAEYYLRRADQAYANANRSTNATIRQIHLDLAAQYTELSLAAETLMAVDARGNDRINLIV